MHVLFIFFRNKNYEQSTILLRGLGTEILRQLNHNFFEASGRHFMKYWGDECQGPRKIYMSVSW